MKHLINIVIVLVVLLFTKTYGDFISFNSIQVDGVNLLLQILIIAFAIQWIAYIPAYFFQTETFYDLTGSLTYLSVFIYCLIATQSFENLIYGNLIVAGAVIIWAIRLGSFQSTM